LFYNTFPAMGEEYFPDTILSHDSFASNMLENPAGVQFVHRYLAMIVFAYVLYVWINARSKALTILQTKAVNFMAIVVVAQFVLGILTLLYAVPVSLGVLHQTGAFFLFAASLFFMHALKKNA